MTTRFFWPVLAALLWGSTAAAQQCFPPLPPVDPQAGDQFGCSVTMGHGHVAVGANLDDEGPADAGSVTLYGREARELVAKLRADDGQAGDQLGFSVAFDGEVLASGAPAADTNRATDAGAVYLFAQTGGGQIPGAWRQIAKLAADDGARGDRFGQSIAFVDGVLLVGAPNHAARGSLSGAVYVFRRNATGTMVQTQKLLASDAAPFDNFGHSVSLDAGTAVVGAPFADPGGVGNAGAAYVFRDAGGSFSQTAKLVGEAAADNELGWSVAVDGGTIVVGSPGDDGAAGAATVFGVSGPPQLLIGPGHPPAARFGTAVSLVGGRLLVGAPEQDNGVVHVFKRSEAGPWTFESSIPAPAGGAGYGQAAFLEGDDLVIGAFEGAGLAQVCTFNGPPKDCLRVEKDSPLRRVLPGQKVTYRIVVRSCELTRTLNPTVTDTFSPLFEAESVTWCREPDCAIRQPGDINETISLPPGGRAVYRASGTLGPTTRFRLLNTACAQTPTMDFPQCDSKRIPIETTTPCDLELDATVDEPVTPGDIATVTLKVTNKGTATATGVTLTEEAKEGWTPLAPLPPAFSLAPGSMSFDIPYLVADDCALMEVEAEFKVTGIVEGGICDDEASLSSPIDRLADLSVTKEPVVPAAEPAPQTVSFTVGVENLGPHCACDVVLSDPTPVGLTRVPSSQPPLSGCDFTADGFRCARLCLKESRALTVAFAIPPADSCEAIEVTNIAAVTSASTDPVPANNKATATIDIPSGVNVSITKSDGVDSVLLGDSLVYTVTVKNEGKTTVTGARVKDTFPFELLAAGWCPGSACNPTQGGPINAFVPPLPPGGSATYRIAGLVSPLCSGSLANTATVEGPPGFEDCNPADNTATDTTACVAPSGVTAWCMSIDGAFLEGGAITKTYLLINGGPAFQADNPGNEFTDTLPASLTLVSAAATTGVASTALNTVTWNGSIPVGGSVTITINATINAGTAGTTICNQATVNFDADGDGVNESSASSDDPNTPAPRDACCFQVVDPAAIPTLSTLGLLAFALLTALLGWARLRRRIC